MRSKAYPSLALGVAVQKVELFNKNLGAVGFYPRDKVAEGIGYKGLSGASSRAIAALVHYGLLERNKDTYSLSELAKKIIFPQLEGEREDAIKAALVEPALFRELVQQYEGNEVPTLLGNILTSPQFGINPRVKEEAAEIFRASLSYAGVFENGRLLPLHGHADTTSTTPDDAPAPESPLAAMPAALPETPVVQSEQADQPLNRIEIVIREGVKAGIYAPYNLSDAEKSKLKTIIDLL